MMIDSHAHYTHKLYEGDFTYLDWVDGEFCIREGNRKSLLEEMHRRGIVFSVEAGTALEKAEGMLELVSTCSPYLRATVGIHPKHCAHLNPSHLEQLQALAKRRDIIAIGETGLDYSVAPEELDKASQKQWFVSQIQLAHQLNLPLILHIRDAYEDALIILRQYRSCLHGGVAHCFGGNAATAMELVDLGFALGIGARVLQEAPLQDAVCKVPLTAILLETDAPYIRPNVQHLPCSGKQRKKVRNSSLVLPAVLEKIASLRGEPLPLVEGTIYQNTLRLFAR